MRIPSSPISIKERTSMLFLQYGLLDVQDGAFVLVDENGVRIQIPIGGVACLFLEPGTTITHAAVSLAAQVGTLLVWVGEGGVRLYASGQPGGARSDKLLYQAKLALDNELRLKVVRAMYQYRFKEMPPSKRSIEQLRGIEGVRVRTMYELLAQKYRVPWKNRRYDPDNWDNADPINKTLSAATHALYGICEAAILAAGYAPAIGFIHTGKPLSFVYDIADLVKFDTVVPIAFEVIAKKSTNPVRDVRLRCRDSFRESKLLKMLIPTIEQILAAGEIQPPEAPPESVPIAIPNKEGISDAGHRY
ncbi:MAG TPA: type I-E CRISPR-associated endonuclease Cas1e [Rectinema sp.]|jgi:CRISPR-associated protein Cas1|nr:type I-E CRISPR-associated endonuclease Cas1e [Rectinema sp.]HOO02548.1 type I-E CRISPR-associated endonuclease Cas1e [Rectinema sp.]HPW02055.1 type I-E CRISPR-associated endonuclease Cas1e [Rectinema sp.]HPW46910.1 type I-E CRISPR-associated endonuclease Cas1e [Rectinema sp.]HQN03461.1 type I-E CRISPR-associated endonuclease Cas1e [Rectinema sp.]